MTFQDFYNDPTCVEEIHEGFVRLYLNSPEHRMLMVEVHDNPPAEEDDDDGLEHPPDNAPFVAPPPNYRFSPWEELKTHGNLYSEKPVEVIGKTSKSHFYQPAFHRLACQILSQIRISRFR